MGWTYIDYPASAAPTMADFARREVGSRGILETSPGETWRERDGEHAEFWYLAECREEPGKVWIGLLLVHKEQRGKLVSLGYKPMDHTMGPFYYSCPVHWVRRGDLLNRHWAHVETWIKDVEAYHGKSK